MCEAPFTTDEGGRPPAADRFAQKQARAIPALERTILPTASHNVKPTKLSAEEEKTFAAVT
jgi:hypothetical protein